MTENNRRIPRNLLSLFALAGLCAFANPAAAQVANDILTVSPASAAQGVSSLTVTFTLDTDLPPPPPAAVLPDSATIGTLSGTSLAHPSQYVVTAVFNVPAGETVGAKDATVVFTGPSNTITFAQSGGFTVLDGSSNFVADSAADTVYDGGWTNGSNGGNGFEPWQLVAIGDGGFFTGSSAENAGGASGDIDTSSRSWGLWATNDVAEAIRPFSAALATGEVFSASFDSGWIETNGSVGLALQNSAGDNLWQFYFNGGGSAFILHDNDGARDSSIPFTGDGLAIEFEWTSASTYRARIQPAGGDSVWFSGDLMAQADSAVQRLRIWNYQAGAGGDHNVYLNSLSIAPGQIEGELPDPYPGYNLFAPIGSTNTWLMNNDGSIVHSWSSTYRPAHSAYLLEDGSLLRTANTGGADFDVGGAGGRIERRDWDNNLLWAFDLSSADSRLHHDIAPLPNGHILAIAWERMTEAEAIAAGRNPDLLADGELWSETLLEIAPTGTYGGTIVWEWHAWDHLVQDFDPAKTNYGDGASQPGRIDLNFISADQADWLHANAVDYNSNLDQIVLSSREFSEVWVIDHASTTAEAAGSAGDLLYRWGNPQAYGAGGSARQQLFVQHDAHWISSGLPGAGNLLVFNNGQGRTNGNWSSVDEIVPPLAPDGSYSNDLPFAPAAPAWSYSASPASAFYAMNVSSAQRLPDGHTLVCNGPTGRFFEVTADGDVLWEYDHGSAVFRVTRYATSYSAFDDTGLDPDEYPGLPYAVVDTGQTICYNESNSITCPATNQPFYGQDSQMDGLQPSYHDNGDGTISDLNTGLMWVQARGAQVTWAAAVANASSCTVGGYTDWRMPTMKETYSLANFAGANGSSLTNSAGYIPFIDTNYFGFSFGGTSTNTGSRIIDAQDWSTNVCVSPVMGTQTGVFGFNFVDGRIKAYPPAASGKYVRYVRGNPSYGINSFTNIGDGTICDRSTGLMWPQNDSGVGMNWSNALAWAQACNATNYLGHNDWRLPNAKELHSLIDYTRSPATTASAAIFTNFNCTAITNEASQLDFPWYWTGTTLRDGPSKSSGVYICFGRAMAYNNGSWVDAHGAGAQRSDPKGGTLSGNSQYTYIANGYFAAGSPQGDAVRIFNFVRLVRDADVDTAPVASFTATPTNGGAPLAVALTDTSTGTITNRFWDFGDGETTNTAATSLTHTYRFPGTATVSLTVSGSLGFDTANRTIVAVSADTVGDGVPDWWRAEHFGGDGTTTNDQSCATCDPDEDGSPNGAEEGAGTLPNDFGSALVLEDLISSNASGPVVTWQSVSGKHYRIQRSTNLLTDAFTTVVATGLAGDPPLNIYTDTTEQVEFSIYRISVE